MNESHPVWIPMMLAELPAWTSSAYFIIAVAGGVFVARRCAEKEAFEDSYVTMGVLGFAALMAVGSLVPGLVVDLDTGSRVLLGLGLAVMGLGGWMSLREQLPGRLFPVMCLLYVLVALVVFAFEPGLFFDSETGTRALFLVGSTFAVPLSVGRLLAVRLGMEESAFRFGIVLTAITLGLWPLAKELVVGAAEERAYSQASDAYESRRKEYRVDESIRTKLDVPGLTVIYEQRSNATIGTGGSAGQDDPPQK